MRPCSRARSLAGVLALLAPLGAGAQAVARTPEVTASLVTYGAWLQPGGTLAAAVRLEVAPGWYVYWSQPGEAGLPTTVEWRLPSGFRPGRLALPVPERYEVAGLVTHVLRGDVVLLDSITVPAEVRGRQTLRATVRYGVCRDVCIPGTAELSVTLPVRAQAPEPDAPTRTLFERARSRVPRPPPSGSRILARQEGARLCLVVQERPGRPSGLAVDSLLLFPGTLTPFAGATFLRRRRSASGPTFLLPPASPAPAHVTGVLAVGSGGGILVDAPVERGSCGG